MYKICTGTINHTKYFIRVLATHLQHQYYELELNTVFDQIIAHKISNHFPLQHNPTFLTKFAINEILICTTMK